jgi:hypothetical protein
MGFRGEASRYLGNRKREDHVDDDAGYRAVSVVDSGRQAKLIINHRYLAYVLGHVPLTGLQGQVLGIQGDLKTANEVVALWEEKHKVSRSLH